MRMVVALVAGGVLALVALWSNVRTPARANRETAASQGFDLAGAHSQDVSSDRTGDDADAHPEIRLVPAVAGARVLLYEHGGTDEAADETVVEAAGGVLEEVVPDSAEPTAEKLLG